MDGDLVRVALLGSQIENQTFERTAVQNNGRDMSTIQKSFPHGKWVDYDTDSIISGLKSKLEIIAPNHLRIQDSALRFRVTFQYQKSAPDLDSVFRFKFVLYF